MKSIHTFVVAAALVAAVAIVAYAADKPAPKERLLRIQSNGQVLAEVRLLAPAKWLCGGSLSVTKTGDATYRTGTRPTLSGTLLFDGGTVVHINGNVEFGGKLQDLGLEAK